MTVVARQVRIEGRVQGVGFRWFTRERARELGLVGWVRNLVDGRVEVWAEGDEPAVGALLDWLESGPPTARVTRLEVEQRAPEGHAAFRVER